MGYQVRTIFKNGDEEFENFNDADTANKVASKARARGAKAEVIMFKGKSKTTKAEKLSYIDALKKRAAEGSIEAQDALREAFMTEVESAKAAGVFNQHGEILVKDATLDYSADPRDADMPDVEDDPASSPDDLSDVEGDYEGGPDPSDIDEATIEWYSGNPAKARALGLSESDIEAWLHSRTAVPMKMSWGQALQSPDSGKANDAYQTLKQDAADEIRAKGTSGR